MSTMTKTSTSSSGSPYKKKGTPAGAPINPINGTTPAEKSEAERLFDKIGTGAYYAVKRPSTERVDRQLRKLISEANKKGDFIINDGSGYFRAGDEDREELEHYVRAELHRAKEIRDKAIAMSLGYNRRYPKWQSQY